MGCTNLYNWREEEVVVNWNFGKGVWTVTGVHSITANRIIKAVRQACWGRKATYNCSKFWKINLKTLEIYVLNRRESSLAKIAVAAAAAAAMVGEREVAMVTVSFLTLSRFRVQFSVCCQALNVPCFAGLRELRTFLRVFYEDYLKAVTYGDGDHAFAFPPVRVRLSAICVRETAPRDGFRGEDEFSEHLPGFLHEIIRGQWWQRRKLRQPPGEQAAVAAEGEDRRLRRLSEEAAGEALEHEQEIFPKKTQRSPKQGLRQDGGKGHPADLSSWTQLQQRICIAYHFPQEVLLHRCRQSAARSEQVNEKNPNKIFPSIILSPCSELRWLTQNHLISL